MPNLLIGLTLDFVIGVVVGAASAYCFIKAKEALTQHRINEILRADNVKLRREKDELQLIVLQNQIDVTHLKEGQEYTQGIMLQCLEWLGEITNLRDEETLRATYAATLRFREKFKNLD